MLDWLFNPQNWTGADGIAVLLGQHLSYTFAATVIALLIGLPIGIYVGHTGRGKFLIATGTNSLRALPTLGLLILLVVVLAPALSADLAFVVPSLIALILLGIPPIMSATYAGVAGVPREVVDAASGMGMAPAQVIFRVELPCAMPLILSGLRGAVLQVVSTATIAAYVSLGGLGRLIIDGQAQGDYSEMVAGAILVAVLALVLDLFFAELGRLIVPRGIRRQSLT